MNVRSQTRSIIERWACADGSARRRLLLPLQDRLIERPRTPRNLARTLVPLRWMLEHAQREGLPVGSDGRLRADFALWASAELGFSVDRSSVYLEAEALVHVLDAAGALQIGDGTARLRDEGSDLIGADNPWLWFWCAFSTGYNLPAGLPGRIWELLLAWWLQPQADKATLDLAVAQAAGHMHAHDVCRDDVYPVAADAAGGLWALASALSFFDGERPGDADRPALNGMGRATTLQILQGAAHAPPAA